ncbi:Ig-like domain-containing protein, partial [Reichenbachiella sp. MALMAid0571]|uniref:Ig-like domain-containing protein n=1 Tax=Reichenbachiella sp. MALMAid0571 TaxID=3143939 RepID=UPI0032DFE2E0
QLLWPGAEVDGEGNPIAWPGWDFVDGVWIQINDGLRPEMELVISVNPETSVIVSYPPATPTCSANPNNPPIAVDDEETTDSITPVDGNVLDNDTDPDGHNLTVNPSPVSGPLNGTLVLNSDGTFTYTPDSQFEGVDTFEYEVCDDGVPSKCTTAIVSITVEKPPLDIPQIFGGSNNPTWYIEGIEEYPDNHVQVFNRWGNLVFELRGYDNNSRNWASESTVGVIIGSNQVPDGTYFFVIDLGDGSKPKSGFVVVNR